MKYVGTDQGFVDENGEFHERISWICEEQHITALVSNQNGSYIEVHIDGEGFLHNEVAPAIIFDFMHYKSATWVWCGKTIYREAPYKDSVK